MPQRHPRSSRPWFPRCRPASSRPESIPPQQDRRLDHMDAKQVWRAALGELQVSLSPANFETWLRDTQLVDVDDQRFRIAVPNGFAKDWLETRYRSLISQTLARIVGYSVQVEFTVSAATSDPVEPSTDGANVHASAGVPSDQHVRVEPTRVGGEGGA